MDNGSIKRYSSDDFSDGSSWVQDNNEYRLMRKQSDLTFISNAKILEDPNVFIGDTGVTTDATNLQFGLKNVRKANPSDDIFDTSGNDLTSNVA
eukprot:1959438-Ditylum_brightwellii.AAC.1